MISIQWLNVLSFYYLKMGTKHNIYILGHCQCESIDVCFLNDWCFIFDCVIKDKIFNNSEPQFLYLKMILIISTSLVIVKIKWNKSQWL